MQNNIEKIAIKAKEASLILAGLDSNIKNNALEAIADALKQNKNYIMAQN